jgi:Family of unknown function (DUF6338)
MAPQTGTAILVLVVFVLPGFVALRYAEQTYRTRAEDSALERVLSALYFSLLSYLLIAGGALTLLGVDEFDVVDLWTGDKPFESYLALASAALAVPLVIAELARRWSASALRSWVLARAGISLAHKTPSGWEHFFLQGRWAYVRATLKDGRVVAGFFGPGSFAGYTAETPDLYLEQRFQLNDDDWFDQPAEGSLGLYVRAEEIVSVEFYDAGGPSPKVSRFRRWRSRLRPNGGKPQSPSTDATADQETGRNLTRGPASGDPGSSAAGSEGLR